MTKESHEKQGKKSFSPRKRRRFALLFIGHYLTLPKVFARSNSMIRIWIECGCNSPKIWIEFALCLSLSYCN